MATLSRHQTGVFNVCYRILHNRGEAEDLAQEVPSSAPSTGCTPSTSNASSARGFAAWPPTCASTISSRTSHSLCSWTKNGTKIKLKVPEQFEVRERSEQIRSALASLPPHYRVVVELRHYQELSYDEIASELNLPSAT
jgi:RNA polymerase sigma factor (sigma-70 family)